MKITLTPQQKLQLEEMHDSTRDGRVRDRIKAVLLASEGCRLTRIQNYGQFSDIETCIFKLNGYILASLRFTASIYFSTYF